nr:permease prefix domain 1-containing protein [Lachnospiraceae bacterium]
MNRTEYLKSLTEQIQNKNARQLVLEEVAAHIEDQKEAYLLSGKSAEEAEELAVKEMGDPIEAGTTHNQIQRPKTDFCML